MTCCSVALVRTVKPDEISLVYEVERLSFREPYPLKLIRALYHLAGELFLVAVSSDGNIIGYAVALPRVYSVCHLVSIAVHPACRGRGVGRILLASIEEACKSVGMKSIVLEVEHTNRVALRMYMSQGYQVVAILPDYYGERRHALVLAKPL